MAARIGKAWFVVASIGLLVSAAFPTDLPGTPETRSGDLHELSFQINVASIIGGVILLTFAVTRDPSWRNFRAIALTFASLVLTGCFVQFATLQKGMPYGWANRFFVLTMMMWVGGFALRARQPGKGPAARGLV